MCVANLELAYRQNRSGACAAQVCSICLCTRYFWINLSYRVRSTIEQYISYIAQGKSSFESVVAHTIKVFVSKFDYFVRNVSYYSQWCIAGLINARRSHKWTSCSRFRSPQLKTWIWTRRSNQSVANARDTWNSFIWSKCIKLPSFLTFLLTCHSRPQRIYCPNCEETYSVPQGGTIKVKW